MTVSPDNPDKSTRDMHAVHPKAKAHTISAGTAALQDRTAAPDACQVILAQCCVLQSGTSVSSAPAEYGAKKCQPQEGTTTRATAVRQACC
jgi:hypothetical protein